MDGIISLDLFNNFWQMLLPYQERCEFAENFKGWDKQPCDFVPSPKALGFIKLSPHISLTSAGEKLISAKRKEEVFLRQLLKFQIPSPYHKPSDSAATFWVKPYLELFRLIRHFGSLKFDELMMFGLQLVDYRKFDTIVQKIEQFRIAKVQNKGSYKVFKAECLKSELMSIYETEINAGNTKTRESRDKSIDKFLKTKASNLHDYTDACIRYLRATGLVNISHIGRSLSIIPEKISEVDFFLNNTDRNPCFVNDETQYITYLGNPALPILQTDNKDAIIDKLKNEFPSVSFKATMSVEKLKDILDDAITDRKEQTIANQVSELKDYKFYDDVQNTFKQIEDNSLYDPSLMLEWNVWRAMTMLDGGEIKAVIDFSSAGCIPAVWEIMRSYIQSGGVSRNGSYFDVEDFSLYVKEYMKYAPLTERDLEAMPYIYLFQLAQSSYGYKEYLVTKTENKETLLDFGFWRTDICREIYKKASEISAALLQVA